MMHHRRPPAATWTKGSIRALLAAVGVNLAGVLPLFLTGAMAVQIGKDMALGPGGIGFVVAAFASVSLLTSAPLGRAVGSLGITTSMRTAAAVSCMALTAAAAAPTPVLLAAALAIGGLSNSLGQPASNALVAARVPTSRFGMAYAIKQSAIPLSILLGGLAVPAIALTLHWRAAYVAAALLSLLAGFLVPANVQPSAGRAERPVAPGERGGAWLLAAGLAAAAIAATSIGAHAASSAVAVGFSESTAGYLVAAGGAAGLAVRLAAGWRADRVQGGALIAAAALCAAGAVGWLMMSTMSPWPFLVGLLAANAFGWGWPGLIHLAVARRFPESTAAASGITQTGVSLGLLTGPVLIGVIATSLGWGLAWMTSAAAAFAGASVMLLARRRLRRARP